ncbi:MAG: VWA domain-containing protein [Phycisphaeraceae bacterium]
MPRRNPKPYEPGLLVTGRRAVLVVVAALVLLGHAALGVWGWDKTIAELPEAAPAEARAMRVKRAIDDDFTFAPPVAESEQGTSAQELIARLLESEPPKLVTDPMELDVELRPLEELSKPAAGELEIDLPAFEIGNDVLAELDTRPPAELDFGEGEAEPGPGDGTGDGTGRGSADLAGDALNNTAAAPTRTGAGTATLVERPTLDGPGKATDVLPQFGPTTDTPTIDFVGLALADTTKIDVPDNLDNDFAYRVTRYTPTDRRGAPIAPAIEPGYFRVDITAQRSLRKLETMPKDVIFIVDTSSSISQDWVAQVTRGVGDSLVTLNEGDRFNVVLFNDKVSLLSDSGPIDANRDNVRAANDFLGNAASVGYTDVNAALRGLLIRDIDPKRVYELVLISDGQSTRGVVNTRDLINLITRDNDLVASIYCVGVGRKQNRELLNFLAYRNKGFSVYADDEEDAAVTIQDLMSRLRYPIIKDVRLDAAGLESTSLFPADLPNIHQGETIRVYGRFVEQDKFTMRLTGRSAGKDVAFTFTRRLSEADRGGQTVATNWAFWKLHDLYSLIIREGEKEALLEQVDELRKKYGLKTLY